MSTFFCKLLPPRPTFAQDMTETEKKLMQEHALYWRRALAEGSVLVFGPVADPKGVWGLGIVEMGDAAEVEAFGQNDPTIRAGAGFKFEFHAMPAVIHR